MNSEPYVIHGAPISLFTRKLEAAFEFYAVPFKSERKGRDDSSELEVRAGTHQIPVLVSPENWALADTTPIITLLDARYPHRRLFPTGPLGVLVHLIEEVLDEWVARVMVHYRWHYLENTQHVLRTMFDVDLSLEDSGKHPVAQWGPRACRATGTELPAHQEAVEVEYMALLGALETQLAETPYALGGRPTAADCMLLGGLRAHTNNDPIPDLSRFEKVLAWNQSGARQWDGTGALQPLPNCTPFAKHVLQLGRDHYAPFLLGNARALEAGDKAFIINTYGTECSYLTRPYPERSRQMIKDRVQHQLSANEQEQTRAWLHEVGLADCFLP